MKEFLSFDTMLAPKLITFFYYLGLLMVLIAGVTAIYVGSLFGGSLIWSLLRGILGIVIGALFVRMTCEAWIIFFKMNEALQEIRKK